MQESLTNVRKHSGQSRAAVVITQHDGEVCIVVEDPGKGFDPDKISEKQFGLEGIRERARLLDGKAEIFSQPRQGSRITVTLPMRAVEDPRTSTPKT